MTKRKCCFRFFLCWVVFVFVFTPGITFTADEVKKGDDIDNFSLEELLNITITTAGKQAEKVSEIPASVVIVTREDIERYGYQDLAEILENIPGLYQNNDYTSPNFGLRGFYTADPMRNVVVLVNNIPQTNGMHSAHWMSFLNIPPEAIDRIEVVRGPMSVIYGSGAFFGAINIFTNKVDEPSLHTVTVAAGTEKTIRTTVRLTGEKDDFKYALNAAYYNTEGLDVPFNKLVDHPELYGVSENPTTKGMLENTYKYFNFSGTLGEVSFDASYVDGIMEDMLFLPPIEKGNPFDSIAVRLGIGYEKKFSESLRSDLKFYYWRNKIGLDFNIFQKNFYGVQRLETAGYNAELNVFVDPSPKLNLTFGFNYYKIQELHNDYHYPLFGLGPYWFSFAEGDAGRVIQSLFGQMNYKISDKLKMVAGLRLEQNPEFTIRRREGSVAQGNYQYTDYTYSDTRVELIPRFALIYSLNSNHFLKLLYGTAINRPSIFQISDNYFGGYYVKDLKPEDIKTIELNYIGNLSKTLQISASVFRNIMRNLIYRSFLFRADELVQSQANVGELSSNGAELTITAQPTEQFHLEFSGTYQKTKDDRPEFKEVETAYSPHWLGYVKIAYFLNKKISFAINGNYVDSMESAFDHTTKSRLGERVPGHFLVGANIRARNLWGTGLFLNIKGSNLFNTEIHYATTAWGTWMTKGQIGRGISWLVTLGLEF